MLTSAVRFSAAIALAAAALVLMLALSAAPSASGADKDCADFKNQRKAQKFFKKHKPKRDPHRLDADHDGIACESNPCPCKRRPAFRLTGHWYDGREARLLTAVA